MDYKEAYEEYKQEHPEELLRVNKLFAYTEAVEEQKRQLRAAKLAKIEACKRKLYGEQTLI